MIKFLDLNAQHASIKETIISKISDAIDHSNFVGGAEIKTFEGKFAEYIGIDNCVAVGNGTDALEIAIKSLNLPRGSEVIVPANSFFASSEAVTSCGHKVVFADVSLTSLNIDLEDVERKITEKTKAVIIVHLYGNPVNLEENFIKRLASRNIKIIEDCAQSHGASINGFKAGTFGDIATFSFYPGKNLGAMGDAGAIVSKDPQLVERCRLLANHGRYHKYDHILEGRNSRLDTIQAMILLEKLKYLDVWIKHRNKLAMVYRKYLDSIPGLSMTSAPTDGLHSYHLFVVMVDHRDQLKQHLLSCNIETSIHYPTLLPKLDAYRNHPQHNDNFVCSEVTQRLISLPIGEHLTEMDIVTVCDQVKTFYEY